MRSVTTTHPRLLRHTLPLLLVVAAMPFPTSLLGRYASVPIALALYGVVNVLAVLLLLWLRHDVESFRLATAPVDPDEWRRFGWELRGNLVVFLLCIPAGTSSEAKGPTSSPCCSSATGPDRHGDAGSVEGRNDPEQDSAVAGVSAGG
jgi:hypothetical protein